MNSKKSWIPNTFLNEPDNQFLLAISRVKKNISSLNYLTSVHLTF